MKKGEWTMKKARKFAGLLLALIMVLSVGVAAFAEDGDGDGETPKAHEMEGPEKHGEAPNNNGKITINDAIPRETYALYQILYLESYSKTTDDQDKVVTTHYAYKANSSWNDFVKSSDISGTYLNVDDSGYVTWNEGADAAKFAQLALEYAQQDANSKKPGEEGYDAATAKIKPVKTATAPVTATPTTKVTVGFTDLKLGYYLIDTSLGSLCSLDTTDPEVEMQEKNEVPKNYKQVKEDSGSGDGAWKGSATTQGENDADIGQQVEFRSVVTVYPGTDNLIFHDKMSPGLTFSRTDADNVKVNLRNEGGSLNKDLTLGTDYTVEFTENETVSHVSADIEGDCTFHVKFSDRVFADLSATGNNLITITYTATLNGKATVGVDGNLNTSRVSYGDDFHATPASTTVTRTYSFPVFKFDKETKEGLSDTKFELHANGANGEPGDIIKLVKTKDGTVNNNDGNKLDTPEADEYRVAIKNADGTYEAGAIDVLTTNAAGKFVINGLDAGTYHLVETAPKDGYNKLKNPVVVNISYTTGENGADGTIKIKQDYKEVSEVVIENGSGSELPSTGGIGTTVFYVVGGIMLVGAGVLLVTKKRMSSSKESK